LSPKMTKKLDERTGIIGPCYQLPATSYIY
jgi:hypothetical protein